MRPPLRVGEVCEPGATKMWLRRRRAGNLFVEGEYRGGRERDG